jgi:hypothetical protein
MIIVVKITTLLEVIIQIAAMTIIPLLEHTPQVDQMKATLHLGLQNLTITTQAEAVHQAEVRTAEVVAEEEAEDNPIDNYQKLNQQQFQTIKS